MTETQIAEALRAHLAGTPDAAPIVWENAPGVWDGTDYTTPSTPFWLVSQVETPPQRINYAGAHKLSGRFIVAVMAKEGDKDGFARTAETSAEAVKARFPTDLALTAGGGVLRVSGRCYAEAGYNDGTYWRVNVHVRWTAYD